MVVIAGLLAGSAAAMAGEVPAPVQVRLFGRGGFTELRVENVFAAQCDGRALKALVNPLVARTGGDATVIVGILQDGAIADRCRVLKIGGRPARYVAGVERRSIFGGVEVTARGGELVVTALVTLEDYVAAVVDAEAASLPDAAREAQAIVSRSYAEAHRGRHKADGYDFCEFTHCQLFRGTLPLEELDDERAGVTLQTKGLPVPAFFHAACGGATSASKDIFGEEALPGVSDLRSNGTALCSAAESFDWKWEVPAAELSKALSLPVSGESRVTRKDAAGRALELIILGKPVRGPQFLADVTRHFGYQTLRSLKLSVEKRGAKLLFKGRGVGHGVGFCQAGAAALAKEGKSAEEILKHYFPEATLTKR